MKQRALFSFGFGSRRGSDRYRIVVRVACGAMAIPVRIAARAKQAFEAEIPEAVGVNMFSDVLDVEVGADKFFAGWRVNSIKAWGDGRRTANANVHFSCARLPYHLHDFL